jgi:hypothetical protein
MGIRDLLQYDFGAVRHFSHDLLRSRLPPRTEAGSKSFTGYMGWVGHGNLGDEAMFERVT